VLIRIGEISAQCARCGGTEFEPPSPAALQLATELKCAACGEKVRYLALLDRIGEEAMRRANEAIEKLKKSPRR
jgi:hypothetical protein